jgi:alkanesulfonate monooxygenase SsuD/methylene tetrahydromethanopterin reductase-like flavin-dependent oxidoreductase (luciferase family)
MDPPKVRVDRMIEHTQILKRLLAGETVTFAGDHYSIAGLDSIPARAPTRGAADPDRRGAACPLRGRPPTSWESTRRSIRARSTLQPAVTRAERIDEKVEWVPPSRRPVRPLEINAWLVLAEVTDDTPTVADAIATLFETEAATLLSSPLVLIGSVAEIEDRLHERRERWGYSYHVIPGDRASSLRS